MSIPKNCLLLLLAIAAGPVLSAADEPPPSAAAESVQELYAAMREKAAQTADAQWKLAIWCEQRGLKDEAKVHFAAVTRLDPKRDAAWKRLGFKRRDGRWLSDEQIAADVESKEATKRWSKSLAAIHKEIHGGRRQAEAEKALAEITDEKVIPALFLEFGKGKLDQALAVQVLGQVRGPTSSKTLAYLAVYGASADVRGRATETLRGRDAADYAEALISLIVDPLKYEVRPVGGPDAPGVLFVEGEQFNVRRFYTAPAPNLAIQPGDLVAFETDGTPAIVRPTGAAMVQAIKGVKGVMIKTEADLVFSMRDLAKEAQRSAFAAQTQLQGDVAAIEALNSARKSFSRVVIDVLKDATGKDAGKDRLAWKDWLADLKGYAREAKRTRPTFDQVMPLAYTPSAFGQLMFLQRPVPDH